MKKTLLMLTVVVGSALTMYGQGRFNFNNLTSGNLVSVGTPNQGASGGTAGQNVGSVYSAQVLWLPGTIADLTTFLNGTPSSSTAVAFFGTTGGGPNTDGAGLFDGGTVATGGAAGTYTMLVQAWFNNGQFSTYALAAAGQKNVGRTPLFQMNVTASPTPAPTTTFAPFTVTASIPEPTTMVLGGLSAAALLIFRRRK